MEYLEIIAPVTRPTEWVLLLTYPKKPDGSLRICLDPQNLNKAIIREHYKAPSLEEVWHQLSGATVFSIMDVKDGFLEYSFGHPLLLFDNLQYRFLRMPFGLKMLQDVFKMRIDSITDRLPCIISKHDNICIFHKTQQQHGKNLLQ